MYTLIEQEQVFSAIHDGCPFSASQMREVISRLQHLACERRFVTEQLASKIRAEQIIRLPDAISESQLFGLRIGFKLETRKSFQCLSQAEKLRFRK